MLSGIFLRTLIFIFVPPLARQLAREDGKVYQLFAEQKKINKQTESEERKSETGGGWGGRDGNQSNYWKENHFFLNLFYFLPVPWLLPTVYWPDVFRCVSDTYPLVFHTLWHTSGLLDSCNYSKRRKKGIKNRNP